MLLGFTGGNAVCGGAARAELRGSSGSLIGGQSAGLVTAIAHGVGVWLGCHGGGPWRGVCFDPYRLAYADGAGDGWVFLCHLGTVMIRGGLASGTLTSR